MDENFDLTVEEKELNKNNKWLERLREKKAFDLDKPKAKPIPSEFLNSKQGRAIGRS